MLAVTPKMLDPATMFLDAMKASVQVIEKEGVKVGYIHVWSYAGEVYQDQLEEELNGRLREADGLVLDLRDGWGGANPKYPAIRGAAADNNLDHAGRETGRV